MMPGPRCPVFSRRIFSVLPPVLPCAVPLLFACCSSAVRPFGCVGHPGPSSDRAVGRYGPLGPGFRAVVAPCPCLFFGMHAAPWLMSSRECAHGRPAAFRSVSADVAWCPATVYPPAAGRHLHRAGAAGGADHAGGHPGGRRGGPAGAADQPVPERGVAAELERQRGGPGDPGADGPRPGGVRAGAVGGAGARPGPAGRGYGAHDAAGAGAPGGAAGTGSGRRRGEARPGLDDGHGHAGVGCAAGAGTAAGSGGAAGAAHGVERRVP